MTPLVMLSCTYLLVVFVACMFTVLVALFLYMIVLDTLYLCFYLFLVYTIRASTHLLKSLSL